MSDLTVAASVAPPEGVYALVTVASAQLLSLPEGLRKNWVTVQAVTEDVWVLFGDSTVATGLTSITAVSTVTANVPALASGLGWRIPAGQERHFDLRGRGDVTHMAHISAGTTGRVEFYKSSGKGA